MTRTATSGSGWQLRGNAADAYQAYLVPAIFEAAAERLLDVAGVGHATRVLDVACGTGVVSRAAARRGAEVTGVDLNPDMLATARRVGAPPDTTITWRQGDATALPFDDGRFDVVLCQEALQFVADPVAALREMRRVAVPGGRVAFSAFRSLDHHPVYTTFADLLGRHAGSDAARMMESPFALGDARTLRTLAHDAGLTDVRIRIAVGEERFPSVEEFVRREAASSPLAGPLAELGEERLDALVGGLERALGPHLDDEGLVFHNETHMVRASA